MKKIALKNIKTKEQAQDIAITWQTWQSTQVFSYEDIINWAEYFRAIGKKFNLITEFQENAII